MNIEELKASGMLLDLGVAVPVRPLRFFHTKPPKSPSGGLPPSPVGEGQGVRRGRSVVIRQPYMGGLIRMTQKWLSTGVSLEAMKDYSPDDNIALVAKHGRTMSEIVAMSIVRGYLTYRLFGWVVAWWLRWRVHPVFLSEAVYQLMDNLDMRPFTNIIKSVHLTNQMRPRLSH